MKSLFYLLNSKEIEIHLHEENEDTITLSKEGLCELFSVNQKAISNYLQREALSGDKEMSKTWQVILKTRESFSQKEGQRRLKAYPLLMFKKLEDKLGLNVIQPLLDWVNLKGKVNNTNNGGIEIIRYNRNNFELDVKVSPKEETVYLTKEQLCALFETTRQNIEYHIKNIYESSELDEKLTRKEILQVRLESNREIARNISYYNLDMIISIGYRINTKRGIEFRKWANNILKQYLIKGFAINEPRIVQIEETNTLLLKKVISLEETINALQQDLNKMSDVMFDQNDEYGPYVFTQKIFRSAEKEIIIIDPYVDDDVLESLKTISKDIRICVYLSNNPLVPRHKLESIISNDRNIELFFTSRFHDRFIIVDRTTMYHIGTSLNSLGNKATMISRIKTKQMLELLLKGVGK